MNPQILQTLKTTPLFRYFGDKEDKLAVISSFMKNRFVPRGAVLIREGELGDEMFILHKGGVEITKTTMEKDQYTVARLNADDSPFFGELALLDEDKRSATITAIEDCEVLVLTRGDFVHLGDANPDIGLVLMRQLSKILSHRLRTTNEDVILLFEALVNEVTSEEIA
ncbi:MAG: cyclic nucleotide-binding domain-containing protein [Deltaproteobacteria bacterium]|nr:cyclic nucleotide-binding domain-containing protein [Deltaproteobacteria bacterium]